MITHSTQVLLKVDQLNLCSHMIRTLNHMSERENAKLLYMIFFSMKHYHKTPYTTKRIVYCASFSKPALSSDQKFFR